MDNWVVQTEERKAAVFSDILSILKSFGAQLMLDEPRARNLLVKIYSMLGSVNMLTQTQRRKAPELASMLDKQQAEIDTLLLDIPNHLQEPARFDVRDAEHHLVRAADFSAMILKQAKGKHRTRA